MRRMFRLNLMFSFFIIYFHCIVLQASIKCRYIRMEQKKINCAIAIRFNELCVRHYPGIYVSVTFRKKSTTDLQHTRMSAILFANGANIFANKKFTLSFSILLVRRIDASLCAHIGRIEKLGIPFAEYTLFTHLYYVENVAWRMSYAYVH